MCPSEELARGGERAKKQEFQRSGSKQKTDTVHDERDKTEKMKQ